MSRVRVLIRQLRVIGTEKSPIHHGSVTHSYDITDAASTHNSPNPAEAGPSTAAAVTQSPTSNKQLSSLMDIESSTCPDDNEDNLDYSDFDLDYSDLD